MSLKSNELILGWSTTLFLLCSPLFEQRQGLVTDKMPLHVLIERYLPLEYRKLLIPVAMSGNKVFPCKWTCPSGSSGPCGWEDSLLAEAGWTLFCGTAPCEGFPQGTSGAINSWHSLELTQAVLWLSCQPAGSHQLLLQVIWRTWIFLCYLWILVQLW